MKGLSLLILVASISFIAGAGLTYVAKTPWSSDMANQASIKPQEGPMLPPQDSVPTDLTGGTGASAGASSTSDAGHQEMGHQHGAAAAGDHQHPAGAAQHDHGQTANAQGMGQQGGTSGEGGHQHGSTGAKHDHGSAKHDHGTKSASPTKAKDTQPLPTDLMGSAGTGPGKTIPSPAGSKTGGAKSAGTHDHGSHNHADHDHGPATKGSPGHSHQSGKPEKTKTKGSSTPEQHSHGAAGHSHGGDGHAGGDHMQLTNPIKPTEASVKTGQNLFNVYCAVCHGNEGRGGAPMANKLAGIPKFTAELLRSVDDNHMFTMVTSGHGPMPGYAEALTPEERWHVTNYVRTLPETLAAEKKAPVAPGGSR